MWCTTACRRYRVAAFSRPAPRSESRDASPSEKQGGGAASGRGARTLSAHSGATSSRGVACTGRSTLRSSAPSGVDVTVKRLTCSTSTCGKVARLRDREAMLWPHNSQRRSTPASAARACVSSCIASTGSSPAGSSRDSARMLSGTSATAWHPEQSSRARVMALNDRRVGHHAESAGSAWQAATSAATRSSA